VKWPAATWVQAHPVLAGALACALVGTANAEYTLATGTHVNEWVALAVPGALDLYVIQALRVHRDVAAAVLVMVAANVASHLLTAGLYPAGYWWDFGITAGVGALAPGIVWRVHSLERTRNRTELLRGVPAGAVKTPEEPSAPEPVLGQDKCFCGATWDQVHQEYRDAGNAGCAVVAATTDALRKFNTAPVLEERPACDECECILGHAAGCTQDPHPLPVPIGPETFAPVHPAWASAVQADVPDSVPEEWSAAEYGDPDAPVPYLYALPDPECVQDDVPEDAGAVHLNVGDEEYIETAKKYVAGTDRPSVRGMKEYAKVGQARAERLLAYLGVRP